MKQTNRLSIMKKGKSVNTNVPEIEQFLGIHMIMGIFCLPAYSNYWAVETRLNVIADTLSRKIHKDLHGSIHLIGNSLKDESKHDKLLKVELFLEMVQANCLKVEPEEVMSINEGSVGAEKCSSEGSVMRLVKHLP